MGPSFTRVRSTKLDEWQEAWLPYLSLGNKACKRILGVHSEQEQVTGVTFRKPCDNSSLEYTKEFVADKYLRRKFVNLNVKNPLEEIKCNLSPKKDPVRADRKEPVSEGKKEPVNEGKKEPASEGKKEPMNEGKKEPASEGKKEPPLDHTARKFSDTGFQLSQPQPESFLRVQEGCLLRQGAAPEASQTTDRKTPPPALPSPTSTSRTCRSRRTTLFSSRAPSRSLLSRNEPAASKR